jgi:hypothetical protein
MSYPNSNHYNIGSWSMRNCYVVDVNQQLRGRNRLSQQAADRFALLSAVAEAKSNGRETKATRRFGWRRSFRLADTA